MGEQKYIGFIAVYWVEQELLRGIRVKLNVEKT
jgi:hypothetical protein